MCVLHECVCVSCMCVGAHMHGCLRLTLGVFLDCSSLYSLRQGLSIEPRDGGSASQANQLALRISCGLSDR